MIHEDNEDARRIEGGDLMNGGDLPSGVENQLIDEDALEAEENGKIERARQRVRAFIVITLMLILAGAIFTPGIMDEKAKGLVFGGLLTGWTAVTVFYFKKDEK